MDILTLAIQQLSVWALLVKTFFEQNAVLTVFVVLNVIVWGAQLMLRRGLEHQPVTPRRLEQAPARVRQPEHKGR